MSSPPCYCPIPYKETPKYWHAAIGSGIVFILMLVLHHILDEPKLIFSLVIFNLVFLSFTFPLNGPLWCKIVWLLLGNVMGVLFGLIRLSFGLVLKADFYWVDFFLSHLIDFLWIVPIWSLALSFLSMMKKRKNKSIENLK